MIKITIKDEKKPFHKIELTKYFQSTFGYGLAKSKVMTDDILEGKTVIIYVEAANANIEKLSNIGICFKISDDDRQNGCNGTGHCQCNKVHFYDK